MIKRFLALFLLVLMLSCYASASVSSLDARETVQERYLLLGETTEILPLDVRITDGKTIYWIVTVLSEDKILFFVPVNSEDGLIPKIEETDKLAYDNFFKTAYFLRGIENLRMRQKLTITDQEISASQSYLAQIADQKNKLELIKSDKDLPAELKDLIDSQLTLLNSFESDLDSVIQSMKDLSEARIDLVKPNEIVNITERPKLMDDYVSLAEKINDAVETKTSYSAERDKFKVKLFASDLSVETKSNYDSWVFTLSLTKVDELKQKIDSENSSIKQLYDYSIPKTVYSELANRQNKREAYSLLYAKDEDLKKLTGRFEFESLKDGYDSVLFYEKSTSWNSKAARDSFVNNYLKAVDAYNNRKYSEASGYAKLARASLIQLAEKGLKEIEIGEQVPVNYTPWYVSMGIVVVCLAGVLLFLKKGGTKLFKKKQEEIPEWKEEF